MKYFSLLIGALVLSACSHTSRTQQTASAAPQPVATQTCAESFNASVDRLIYALQTQNGVQVTE